MPRWKINVRSVTCARPKMRYTTLYSINPEKKNVQSISSVIFLPRKNVPVGCGIHFNAIKSLSICYKFLSRLIYTYSIPKILWVYISSQSVPNIAQLCPAATVTGKVFCCVSTLIPNPIGSLFPVKNAIYRYSLKWIKRALWSTFRQLFKILKSTGTCAQRN